MPEPALVLVLSHDQDVLALTEAVLDAAGHEVVAGPVPDDALERLRGRRPDVILLAARSPGTAHVQAVLGGYDHGRGDPPPIIVLVDAPAHDRDDGRGHDAAVGDTSAGWGRDNAEVRDNAGRDMGERWASHDWAERVVEVLIGPLTPLLLVQTVEDVVLTQPEDAVIRRRAALDGRQPHGQPRSAPTTM